MGPGPSLDRATPEPERIAELSAIAHVAASSYHAVALAHDGKAYCWGSSRGKECGIASGRLPVTLVAGGS